MPLCISDGTQLVELKKITASSGAALDEFKKLFVSNGTTLEEIWSGGELAYYGKLADLPFDAMSAALATTEAYLFVCSGIYSDLVAYNQSLQLISTPALTQYRANLGSSEVGNIALFTGGKNAANNTPYAVVDGISNTLTLMSVSSLSLARSYTRGINFSGHAIFAGGMLANGNPTNVVDGYNKELARVAISPLTVGRYSATLATTIHHLLVASGTLAGYGRTNTVEPYNDTLTKLNTITLAVTASDMGASGVGSYALLMGGSTTSGDIPNVFAIDDNLTIKNAPSLLSSISGVSGGRFEDYGMIVGGNTDIVEVYLDNLTKATAQNLSGAGKFVGCKRFHDYFFASGGSGAHKRMTDVWTLN